MKLYWVAFGLWACTTGLPNDASTTVDTLEGQNAEDLVRIETRAGTFLVRQNFAKELQAVLSDDATRLQLYAGK